MTNLVSEWMGYILLRESMLDSVIRARNRWLKPGGSLYPSHATMLWSLVSFEDDREGKYNEFTGSMREWEKFSAEMKNYYNVDVRVLSPQYEKEQADYYIYSALWTELSPEHIVGQPVVIKRLDLNTCTLFDAADVKRTEFNIEVPFPIRVSGFAGWFTVDFAGSVESPATKRVTLSTGPEVGYTHWGQQVFYLKDPIDCTPGTCIMGSLEMIRQEKNKRLYNLNMTARVDDSPPFSATYEIP
jgi:protein arginine N-methyltransferase 1